ncbi:MAG: hypothetical protein LC750_09630 [Actinobacteria bacterium]|nr:hypothetical protein [Actinomycetota bacterium]
MSWHRSGNTTYGNRGDITVRFERSTDAEPYKREWREGGFKYEAQWYGRIAEELADGGVKNEAGDVFTPDLFQWHRRSQTSHPPGIAPPAAGPTSTPD